MADVKTYSLTDLGISNDDLGLLLDSGYDLNQTSGISEAKKDEILAKVYELKKEKASKQEEDVKLKEAIGELKKGLENASTEDEKKQVLEKFNNTIGTTVYSDHTMAENSSHEEIADRVTTMMKSVEAKSVDGEKTEYNAEDIETLMKQMDIYLLKPEEVENSDILKASNPNYEQTHRQLFEEHVQLCSKIIKDYGEGRIDVTPDAIAPMGEFISKFGKEYIADAQGRLQSHESGNKYDLTSEAQLAGQRLAYEKLNPQVTEEKASIYEKIEKEVKAQDNYLKDLHVAIDELTSSVVTAKTEEERKQAIEEFNKKISTSIDRNECSVDKYIDRTINYIPHVIKDNEAAAKILLDEDGKLKSGLVAYIPAEERGQQETPVQTEEKEQVGYMQENKHYIRHDVPTATPEQVKQANYDAKNGKEVSLQDMASVVKSSTLVSKDLRDQLPNVIKSAVEKDSLTAEETAALGYLLDELNGKHVEDKKNSHAIHEYNKRFADMPELLEQADKKLKESSVTVTPAAEKTYIEEEAEELPKNRRQEDKKGYSKEEIKEAKIKKDKDKTLRDWIILKSDIENNPNMSDGQKAYAIKSLIDQARTYKMTDPKKTTDEELKDADEFMQEFGYDYDKKGRASTNPIARKWKDAIDKRIKEQEQDRGRGGPTIIPVVIPHGNEGNDNVVVPSDDKGNENITPSDDKKKKGLFGWIGEKAKKAWDWTKRNARKVALIGTVALLGFLGTKSCEGGEKDDVKKDNPEYVAPAPTPEKDTESKDTIDLAMAHQYCKRMGYQDSMSQEDAIAKYLMDRETYSSVKDKYAYHMGFDKNTSIDEQMAILATVRGNTPKDAPVIDAILNARDVNIASVAKLKPETAKFVVNQENGTIQYRNPEEFTKQTGTQSIEVSKDKLTQQAENLGFVVQAKGGNTY